MDAGPMSGPGQGFQYPAPGQGLSRGFRELDGQLVEIGGCRFDVPGARRDLLGQQPDLGRRSGNALARQKTAHQVVDRLYGKIDLGAGQTDDLQQSHACLDRIFGVDGLGQEREQPFEFVHAPLPQGLAQLVRQFRDHAISCPQCLSHLGRSCAVILFPFSGADAPLFCNGIGERKILWKQIEQPAAGYDHLPH